MRPFFLNPSKHLLISLDLKDKLFNGDFLCYVSGICVADYISIGKFIYFSECKNQLVYL